MTADDLDPRLSDEDCDRVLDVNLTAAFFAYPAPALGPDDAPALGRVVDTFSVVGLRANPGQADCAARRRG